MGWRGGRGNFLITYIALNSAPNACTLCPTYSLVKNQSSHTIVLEHIYSFNCAFTHTHTHIPTPTHCHKLIGRLHPFSFSSEFFHIINASKNLKLDFFFALCLLLLLGDGNWQPRGTSLACDKLTDCIALPYTNLYMYKF